jgi:hypothetical protein
VSGMSYGTGSSARCNENCLTAARQPAPVGLTIGTLAPIARCTNVPYSSTGDRSHTRCRGCGRLMMITIFDPERRSSKPPDQESPLCLAERLSHERSGVSLPPLWPPTESSNIDPSELASSTRLNPKSVEYASLVPTGTRR